MISIRCLLLAFIFFVPGSRKLLAQNYFVSNLYHNLVFSNPAYALYTDFSTLQLNYRNQWPSSTQYTSYGAAGFYVAENLNSSFGAIVNYDNEYQGTFTRTAFGGNYAYKMQTGHRSHLLFGLQAFYNLAASNYSGLTFENPAAPVPANQQSSYTSISSGIGILLNEEHFLGASVINLLPTAANLSEDLQIQLSYRGIIRPRGYYNELHYEPLVNISSNLIETEALYGMSVVYSGLKGGLIIRQNMFRVNALIILLGISFENYQFVYTNDINLSGVVSVNPKMAAHEVTFLTKIKYKARSKRKGAIKCPDI